LQGIHKEQTIALWGRWVLCNPQSGFAKNVVIVSPFISKMVVSVVDLLSNPSYFNAALNKKLVQRLGLLDKYLYDHQDVLSSRLIFFVVNDVNAAHWYGFCVVNPWKAVTTQHAKEETEGLNINFLKDKKNPEKAGLFYNDPVVLQNTKPDTIEKVLPFLWLLNMMSHYRDMDMVDI
jgi:hypothetical protein